MITKHISKQFLFVHIVSIFVFSILYSCLHIYENDVGTFSDRVQTYFNSLGLAAVTQTTIGYGRQDFFKSNLGKFINLLHIFTVLFCMSIR